MLEESCHNDDDDTADKLNTILEMLDIIIYLLQNLKEQLQQHNCHTLYRIVSYLDGWTERMMLKFIKLFVWCLWKLDIDEYSDRLQWQNSLNAIGKEINVTGKRRHFCLLSYNSICYT